MRRAVIILLSAVVIAGAVRLLLRSEAVGSEQQGVANRAGCTLCEPAAVAPSGNAVLNQYLETVPSSTGSRPSAAVLQALRRSAALLDEPAGGEPGAAVRISRATIRSLRALGRSGSATAALAYAAAPRVPRAQANEEKSASGTASNPAGSAQAAYATILAGSGSDGLGFILPVSLGVIVILASVTALSRRRRRG